MMGQLGFAHRGGRAVAAGVTVRARGTSGGDVRARENTLPAFRRALRLGAPGLETDVWLTADAVPVLHHGGKLRVGRAVRRRPIASLTAAELPAWLPRLGDLYDACGTDFDLSVDLNEPTAGAAVVRAAGDAGHASSRLWLCGGIDEAARWRTLAPDVRLVSSPPATPVASRAWNDRLHRLRSDGVDAVNLPRRHWSRERVQSVHAVGLRAFGWDAQSTERIAALLDMGCDAVYSDHVDRLVAALRRADGPPTARWPG
ncbi:MAG: hypothetical protein NVSMB55_27500 [Mycobacteriales bacterium]